MKNYRHCVCVSVWVWFIWVLGNRGRKTPTSVRSLWRRSCCRNPNCRHWSQLMSIVIHILYNDFRRHTVVLISSGAQVGKLSLITVWFSDRWGLSWNLKSEPYTLTLRDALHLRSKILKTQRHLENSIHEMSGGGSETALFGKKERALEDWKERERAPDEWLLSSADPSGPIASQGARQFMLLLNGSRWAAPPPTTHIPPPISHHPPAHAPWHRKIRV